MKKVLNVMLVMLLIVSVVSVNAFAAGGEFGINVSATSVNPGDTVTVELIAPADGLQDVSALALGITFDSTKVEMTTRSSADIKAAYLATFEEDDPDAEYYTQTMTSKNNANKNGVVTIATTNANLSGYDIPGEAVLLKAVFKVKDDAVGAITFGIQAATVSVYVDDEPVNVVSQYSADATGKATVICEHPSYKEVVDADYLVSAATCEDDAVYYKSCSVCGEAGPDTFVAEDTALGHYWGDWTETTAPTCSAKGEETRTCANDAEHKEYRDVAIDPTAHKWGDWTETTAPTCSAKGEETRICANDAEHKEYRDVAIDPTAHEWGDWAETTAPTCSAKGEETRVCKNDANHTDKRDVEIDADAHTWGDWTETTAPTCSAKGEETRVCVNDAEHKEYRDVAIDPTAHKWGDWVETTAPTCCAEGEQERVCEYNADHKEPGTVPVDPSAHNYIRAVTEPTCTEKGYTTYTCSRNSEHSYVDDYVDAKGHTDDPDTEIWSWADDYSEASCTLTCGVCGVPTTVKAVIEVGSSTAKDCTEIGKTTYVAKATVNDVEYTDEKTVEGAAGPHDWSDWMVTTDPTCTEAGEETRVCSHNSDHKETRPVEATGHNYEAVVTAPTCTEQGYTTYTCGACGDTYVADYVEATGHNYEAVVTAPTCTEQGYTTYTCDACGDTYVADYVAATDHDWGDWAETKAPTCVAKGEEQRVCKNDAEHIESRDVEIDPDAHDLGMGASEGKHWEVCGREGCGYESDPVDCTFDENKYASDENQHWIVCDVCGMTEKGEHEDHAWGEWVTEQAPTSSKDGYALRQCETCGLWDEKVLPATGNSGSGSGSGSDKDNSNIPDTGDDAPIALMAAVLTVCAAGVVVLTSKKRKNEN